MISIIWRLILFFWTRAAGSVVRHIDNIRCQIMSSQGGSDSQYFIIKGFRWIFFQKSPQACLKRLKVYACMANYTLNWTKIHLQPFMMNYWLSDPPCVDNIWHLILSIWRTTLPAARVQKNNINLQIIDIIDYSHNATLIDVQFG